MRDVMDEIATLSQRLSAVTYQAQQEREELGRLKVQLEEAQLKNDLTIRALKDVRQILSSARSAYNQGNDVIAGSYLVKAYEITDGIIVEVAE